MCTISFILTYVKFLMIDSHWFSGLHHKILKFKAIVALNQIKFNRDHNLFSFFLLTLKTNVWTIGRKIWKFSNRLSFYEEVVAKKNSLLTAGPK